MNLFEMLGIEAEVKEEKKEDKKAGTSSKKATTKTTAKPASAAKPAEVKKFKLPITVNYLVEYSLTQEDFGGLDEVDEDQILNLLITRYDLYVLSKKTATFDYLEERNTLVVYTKSATKGGGSDVKVGPYRTTVDGSQRWAFNSNYMSFIGGLVNDNEEMATTNAFLTLKQGKIPYSVYEEVVAKFKEQLPNEYLAQIFLDIETGEYFVDFPKQLVNRIKVYRECGFLNYKNDTRKPLICEIHSHNYMLPLHFSEIDDDDEVNFKIYGIIGFSWNDTSKVFNKFRLGSNGSFLQLSFDEIFESNGGTL